jgi:hypothetical protein
MERVALVGAKIRTGLKTGWAGEDGHLTYDEGALVLAGAKTMTTDGGSVRGRLARVPLSD